MPFDHLKKTFIASSMPFSVEVSEHTKLMTLCSWLHNELKTRKERLALFEGWSKEKLEGYEQGLIDMALDVKNEIKKLDKKE